MTAIVHHTVILKTNANLSLWKHKESTKSIQYVSTTYMLNYKAFSKIFIWTCGIPYMCVITSV